MTTGTGPQPADLRTQRLTNRLLKGAAAGLLAGTLLVGGAAGVPAAAQAANAESQDYLDDARQRLEEGDANAALIQLRNALQADPQNWQARRLLGRLYLGAGHFEAAEKELQRYLEAEPGDAGAALLLAQARFGLGNPQGALEALPEQVDDPEQAYDAKLLRTEGNLALGRIDEAAALVEELRGERLTDGRVSILAARTAIARGQPEEAERFAREATESDPESAAAWLLRGQVALGQRRLDEAAEYAERAQSLAPGSIAGSLLLAETDLRRGRFEAAGKTLDALLEIAPEAVEPRYLKATQLAAQKDFEGAERLLDQLSEPLQDYRPAQFLTAMVKYQVGRYAQARTLVEGYLAEDPDNPAARRLLAATLLRSDNPGRAAEVLAETVERQSGDPGTLRLLATAQMRAGDFTAATETLRRLAQVSKGRASAEARSLADVLEVSPDDLQVEGQQLANEVALVLNDLQLGELDSAERGAEALVESHPDNPVAHNTLAGVLLVRGHDEQARKELERALELDDRFRAAYENLDRLDARAGDHAAIEQRRKAYVERYPQDSWGLLHYAAFLAGRDRGDEGRRLIEQALEAQPESRELLVASVNLAMRAGDEEDAAAKAERLADRRPDDAQAQLQAGQALLRMERFEAAAARLEQARTLTGGKAPQPLELLVQARLGAEDLAGAEEAAEALAEAQPESYPAKRLLVDLYVRNDKRQALQDLFARVGERDAETQARLQAHAALREGRDAEAADLLEAIEDPSPATVEERFVARHRAGDADRALAQLRDWVSAHPREPGPALLLANRLIGDEAYEEAEAVLTAALPAATEHPVLLNNLAWLRDELGKDGAVQLARRAIGLAPDSPDIADTLGWILVRRGELEEGEALLRQAAGNAPDNPAVAYHLAYALAKNGEPQDAISILEQITEADDARFAQAEQARTLLGELRGAKKN